MDQSFHFRRVWLAICSLLIGVASAQNYNGLALTPPMGWNSWNKFDCGVTDAIIRKTADALVSTGMAAAGYKYVNIDDCWSLAGRTSSGHIQADPKAFPNGIKPVADYVHSKGLKLGIYGCRGTLTCASRAGSYGHETSDANDFASWGVDYLKYDNCNPASGADLQKDYTNMKNALVKSGRDIVFSQCAWWFYDWEATTGNLWRTSGDIKDSMVSMLRNFDVTVALAKNAKPGAWNDPDMLEVGNGGMTDVQYRSHMSLWAIMASPLIAGNDIANMSSATKAILMAPEIIAVDQDSLGKQGVLISNANNLEVISKTLKGTNVRAVALFNRGNSNANMTVTWSQIGLPAGSYLVRDLWAQKDLGNFSSSYSTTVGPQATVMIRIGLPAAPPPASNIDKMRLEAENAQLGGGATVVSDAASSNGAYVNLQGGNMVWTDSLTKGGTYDIALDMYSPYGTKVNSFFVDGDSTAFTVDSSTTYGSVTVASAKALKAGTHTFTLGAQWGWIYVDYLRLVPSSTTALRRSQNLGEPAVHAVPGGIQATGLVGIRQVRIVDVSGKQIAFAHPQGYATTIPVAAHGVLLVSFEDEAGIVAHSRMILP